MMSGHLEPILENESLRFGPDDLSKPLLSQDSTVSHTYESDDESECTVESVARVDLSFVSMRFVAVCSMVVGGVAASAAAIASVQAIAVYVAGGVCLLNAPWVVTKQYKIAKGKGVRRTINFMLDRIELLREKGQILRATVADLKEEVECLNDIQLELDNIAQEQGWNSTGIVNLVNENEDLLQQMKNNVREVAMADITRILLSCDKSGNMRISLKELNTCTIRIRLELSQRGVDLDEDRFKTLIRKDNDISQILKVIAAIMFQEPIDDKHLNEYTLDAMEEEARQDDLTSSIKAVGRLKRLAETHKLRYDEEDADLFLLQDRYTQGSVDVARGNRTTLSRATSSTQDSSSSRSLSIIQRYTVEMKEQNKKSRERLERQKEDRNLTASMIINSLQRDEFIPDLNASMIRDDKPEQNLSSSLIDDYERHGALDPPETDLNASSDADDNTARKKKKKKSKKNKKSKKSKKEKKNGDTEEGSSIRPDDYV